MKEFMEIKPAEIAGNVVEMVGQEWMLVTAGRPDTFNTMTASWGGLGELWFKPVCFCFIRPTRFTYEFIEAADAFTLSFFEKDYQPLLTYCGSHSGREVDKIRETGLTPRDADNGGVFFDEARLVLECRKMYFHDIDPAHFLDESIADHYSDKDYHRLYIAEITRVLQAQ